MDDPLVKYAKIIGNQDGPYAERIDVISAYRQAIVDLATTLRAERARRCETCCHIRASQLGDNFCGNEASAAYCGRVWDDWFCATWQPREEVTP